MNIIWSVGIISGVIASAITALFQLFNGFLERRSAEKRHFRELALKAAVVQWEHDVSENKRIRDAGEARAEPLTDVDFDRVLFGKLRLIESFGKRPSKSKKKKRD